MSKAKTSKAKNGGISGSLIAILVLSILALAVTVYKKSMFSGDGLLQNGDNERKENIFVEPKTVTPVPDAVIDKRLDEINKGENEVNSSFKDSPVLVF